MLPPAPIPTRPFLAGVVFIFSPSHKIDMDETPHVLIELQRWGEGEERAGKGLGMGLTCNSSVTTRAPGRLERGLVVTGGTS